MSTENTPTRSRFAALTQNPAFWFAALIVLCIAHVAINIWWLQADNHVIRTDEEMHMQFARDYYDAFNSPDYKNPIERVVAMANIVPRNPAHPPLLHVLGGVTATLLGYNVDSIAFTSTLLLVLVLLGCWFIARLFLSPGASFFSVFVVSLTPMIFAGSRNFMTDYLSMTIVVWSIYALLKSDGFRVTGWVFVFALLNGLGIATRTVTPVYYFLPSAIIFAAGIYRSFSFREGFRFDRTGAGKLVLNALLTIVVTVGIGAPWYLRHIDTMYDYWANKYGGQGVFAIADLDEQPPAATGQPATAPPVALDQSATTPPVAIDTPASPADENSVTAVVQEAEALWASFAAEPLVDRVLHPSVPWWRYLLDLNNELMLMPLLVLAAIGILLGMLLGRLRSRTFWFLLFTVICNYVIMTVVFRHSTPRYVLQIVPFLAMFAAFPVIALPRGKMRVAAGVLLTGWLIFQFVNLTFTPLGPVARVAFDYGDEELVVYKDILTASDAFSRLSAPTQENYKHRMLQNMCKVEAARSNVARGEFANYVVVGFRGLEFEQKHYWPPPNPYRIGGLPPEYTRVRKFRQIALNAYNIEPVLPYLSKAEYVVYAVRPEHDRKEAHYRNTLESAGFREVERWEQEGFGFVPTRFYAVYAHEQVGETLQISTTADIDQLGAVDLYYLRRAPNFSVLAPALREHADARFKRLMAEQYPGEGYPVAPPEISLMDVKRESLGGGAHEFTMVFKVNQSLEKDYRMYFHGVVAEEDKPKLPQDKRKQGYIDWNFYPSPPTSDWRAGEYIMLKHTIEAPPLAYRIRFGFFEKATEQFYGNPVFLDWQFLGDGSEVPEATDSPASPG